MNKPTLGQLISGKRAELGLSQNALAKEVGTSHMTIWAAENERYGVSAPETIERLAEALGITTDDIYAATSAIPPDIDELVRQLDAAHLGKLRSILQEMTAE